MTRVEVPSYPVSIFIAGDPLEASRLCQDYCDVVGLCVTITETCYTYTGGFEDGCIVGLINYPRFVKSPETLFATAEALALRLIKGMGQQSCTIQARDKTVWISFRDEP